MSTKQFIKHGGTFLIANPTDNAMAKAKPAYTLTTKPNETYFLRLNACFAKKIIELVSEEIVLKELRGLREFEKMK